MDEHRRWILQKEKRPPRDLLEAPAKFQGESRTTEPCLGTPSFEHLRKLVMTIEQLQRRYHWLKYEADFIADAAQASVISEEANQVMAEITRRLTSDDSDRQLNQRQSQEITPRW